MKNFKEKKKKQFRLYDLYRLAVTGFASKIEGLVSYQCNEDATVITVVFENTVNHEGIGYTYVCETELQRREMVREVNSLLSGKAVFKAKRRDK